MRLKRIVEGLTLVGFGLIFLGIATGTLAWSVWLNLLSLWPILLIAIGIDITGKGLDQPWLRVVSSLLVLGGLVFGVVTSPTRDITRGWGFWGAESVEFENAEPADPRVKAGEARVSGAVGKLTVEAGGDLVSASGSSPFGEPIFDVSRDGRSVEAEISMGERGTGVWGIDGESYLDVKLSRDVLWDLRVETGVSSVDADLRDLPLSALVLEAGVSDVVVTLGDVPSAFTEVPVSVEVGIASTRLRIPAGADVRIVTKTGLANVSIPEGVREVADDVYESRGFARASNRYVITVDSGIADVRIEWY
jgi:hypothetical protein